MPKKICKAEGKVEALAVIQKAAGRVQTMLKLKDAEMLLDHENDLKAQQVLELLRMIKYESKEERISAYAHVAESYLIQQIEIDQKDDVPWKEERDLVLRIGNELDRAIEQIRKL